MHSDDSKDGLENHFGDRIHAASIIVSSTRKHSHWQTTDPRKLAQRQQYSSHHRPRYPRDHPAPARMGCSENLIAGKKIQENFMIPIKKISWHRSERKPITYKTNGKGKQKISSSSTAAKITHQKFSTVEQILSSPMGLRFSQKASTATASLLVTVRRSILITKPTPL